MMHEYPIAGTLSENVYAHKKRFSWISGFLKGSDRVVDLGCGTGFMLTLPLLLAGFDIIGVDRDKESVAYGRRLAVELGIAGDRIVLGDLSALQGSFDVVIASEVLEHLDDVDLDLVLTSIFQALRPGGLLLLTVPNGYGWFELESFIWNRLRLGTIITKTRMGSAVRYVKAKLSGKPKEQWDDRHPSSFDASPHVQRFTMSSLRRRIDGAGFHVIEMTGSAMFAGQISNLLFAGYDGLTRLNASLADKLPAISAGFYAACVRDDVTAKVPECDKRR